MFTVFIPGAYHTKLRKKPSNLSKFYTTFYIILKKLFPQNSIIIYFAFKNAFVGFFFNHNSDAGGTLMKFIKTTTN